MGLSLQLLIVPLMLSIVAGVLGVINTRKQSANKPKRLAKSDKEIAENRRRQRYFESYFDRIANLILDMG